MDVPKRIVDDPSADSVARALIEDARVETAGPGGKARTLAALGLAGGAGLASTSTAFAGLKVLGAGVLDRKDDPARALRLAFSAASHSSCSSWAASWAWVHG